MFRFTCLFAASATQTLELTITPSDDAFNVAFTAPADTTWCAIGSQDDVTKQMEGIKGHIFKLSNKVSPENSTPFEGKKKTGAPTFDAAFESHFTALGYTEESREITATLKKNAKNVAYACGEGEAFPPEDIHTHRGLKPLEQDSQPEGEPEAEPEAEAEPETESDEPEAGGDSDDSDSAAGAVSVMMIFATLL